MKIQVFLEKRPIVMVSETDAFRGPCPKCERDAFLFRPDNKLFCYACGFRAIPDRVTDAYRAAFRANTGVNHDAR